MSNIFQQILKTDEFREEYFVAEAQAHLSSLMDEKGITRAELARKLGVSRARVTQIFSDEAKNLTLRLLARSFLALGEEPLLFTKREYDALQNSVHCAVKKMPASKPPEAQAVLTASLIAELLRANSVEGLEHERSSRRGDTTREWAQHSPNVVPLRRAANG